MSNKANKNCKSDTAEIQQVKDNDLNEMALDSIISKMKRRIDSDKYTRAEKIQVLTMVPEHWSKRKVREVYNISDKMVEAKN